MSKIDLNVLAKKITLKEGLKKQLSIAQVKEVLKLVLKELKGMALIDISDLLKRLK